MIVTWAAQQLLLLLQQKTEGWNRNWTISQLPQSNQVFFLLHILLRIESDVPFVASFLSKEKASSCTSALRLLNPVTKRFWRVVGFTPNPELSVYSSSFTTVEPRTMFSTSGCESITRPTRAAANWSSLRAFQVGKVEEKKNVHQLSQPFHVRHREGHRDVPPPSIFRLSM